MLRLGHHYKIDKFKLSIDEYKPYTKKLKKKVHEKKGNPLFS